MNVNLGLRGGTSEVELDEALMWDLWNMWYEIPGAQIGLEGFLGMTLCNGFTIEVPKIGLVSNDGQQELFKRFYIPWLREVYKWIQLFGMCPYYLRELEDQSEFVPVVPPYSSGKITTYMDEDHIQRFQWYWIREMEPDEDVIFIIERPPLLNGTLTSVGMSLIRDYKLLVAAMDGAERVIYHSSRLPYFFEYNPPKNKPGEDNLGSLAFAEEEDYMVRASQHASQLERNIVDRRAFQYALANAHAKNRGRSGLRRRQATPILYSESSGSVAQREEDDWHDRVVPLEPHWKSVQPRAPTMVMNPEVYAKRLDELASALVGFPLSMVIEAHASRSANVEGNMRAANERIKETLAKTQNYIREAFLMANRDRFEHTLGELVKIHSSSKEEKEKGGDGGTGNENGNGNEEGTPNKKRKRRKLLDEELLALTTLLEVEVKMDCTPLITRLQLRALWEDGVITQKTYARHVTRLFGIPEADIQITPINIQEQMMGGQSNKSSTSSQGQASSKKRKSTSSSEPRKSKKKEKSGSGDGKRKKGDNDGMRKVSKTRARNE